MKLKRLMQETLMCLFMVAREFCPTLGGERSIRSAAGGAILCDTDLLCDLAKCHLHFPSAEAVSCSPCHGG